MENMETAKKVIEVTVRDRVATHIGDDFYVCGNTEYEIHFDFDEEWDALDIKTARFIADGNVLYPDRIFSGNVCSFPDNPPISNTTSVRVGVFAGNLHTTTPARIPAVKSILCGTPTPAAPDEDAYHEAMKEMAKVATDARAQAEASAKSAEESAQSAQASAKSAEASAQSADASAQSAQESAKSAEESAQSAQASAGSAEASAQSAAESNSAKEKATAQADDAEDSANDAKSWAGRAEAFAGNAAASASDAGTQAQASAASATDAANSAEASAQSAEASAQSAVEAAESVKDFYIVKANNAGKSNRTYAEIRAAINKYKLCLLVNTNSGKVYTFCDIMNGACVFKVTQRSSNDSRLYSYVAEALEDSTVRFYSNPVVATNPKYLYLRGAVKADYYGGEETTVNLPTEYPNPHKLTLTGAVDAEYDGSSAVSVTIPKAPEKLPNPFKLKLTGAVDAEYDGSGEVSVEIPAGGGGAGLPETADPLKQLVTDESGKVGWEERLAYKHTAQVVNLAATALMFISSDDGHALLTPWAADVTAGAVCNVNYNGTDYECTALPVSVLNPDMPDFMHVLGNLDALGVPGIEGSNAEAPFVLIALVNEYGADEGVYGQLMAIDGAEAVTLAVSSETVSIKKIDPGLLPKPETLTFTGAVEATYDGREPVTINIPTAQSIPTPTARDAGKFLRVNTSGAYTLAAIANAEEATF